MFNKIYALLKRFIKNNLPLIIIAVISIIVFNIRVPYVIYSPGGVLPLNTRIRIDDKLIDSSYYTTYVSSQRGTIATLIAGYIMPKWDVIKLSEITGDSSISYDDMNLIDKYSLKEGDNTSIMVAFNKAGIKYETLFNKAIILYKDSKYKNDLEVNDEIISCNDKKILSKDDLSLCIQDTDKDFVNLEVFRDKKKYKIKSKLYKLEDRKVIGVGIFFDETVLSDKNINIINKKNEFGSSGGLMNAIAIYDGLLNKNYSKSIKIAGTGTIDIDGTVGEIGGIKYKLLGAEKNDIDIFLCPVENYKEAIKYKKKYKLKLGVVKVGSFDDAIKYLDSI